jgi:hypothetical protein
MFWMGSCRRDFPKSEFMPIRRRFRYASCTFSQAVSPGSACRNRGRLAALCPRFAIRPPRFAIRPPRFAIRPPRFAIRPPRFAIRLPRPPRVPTRPCGSYVHALSPIRLFMSSASGMGPVEGFSAMSMGPPGRQ